MSVIDRQPALQPFHLFDLLVNHALPKALRDRSFGHCLFVFGVWFTHR